MGSDRYQNRYDFVPAAIHNQTVEESALIADAEADRLDVLATEMQQQINTNPRRGLKWTMETYKAGARAARRIASSIRQTKVEEEEG
jgi:hypothetical protein